MNATSIRLVLASLAVAAAIVGVKLWESHLVAKGDAQGAARVQAQWDAAEAARNNATARDNVARLRNAERTAHEDANREAARRAGDAAAAAAVRSLRAEVARLNARPNPYPAGDAGIAASAREAAAARELLAESADAYTELAAAADGLRDQVVGLQAFAQDVCRAGQDGGAVD